MALIDFVWVPVALLAGFACHRVLSRRRSSNGQAPGRPQRYRAALLPLFSLLVWLVLCYGFKLLTWAPFAGDGAGSVELTNGALLAGSALAGTWISVRLRK